jgi:hypothetical protein
MEEEFGTGRGGKSVGAAGRDVVAASKPSQPTGSSKKLPLAAFSKTGLIEAVALT